MLFAYQIFFVCRVLYSGFNFFIFLEIKIKKFA